MHSETSSNKYIFHIAASANFSLIYFSSVTLHQLAQMELNNEDREQLRGDRRAQRWWHTLETVDCESLPARTSCPVHQDQGHSCLQWGWHQPSQLDWRTTDSCCMATFDWLEILRHSVEIHCVLLPHHPLQHTFSRCIWIPIRYRATNLSN